MKKRNRMSGRASLKIKTSLRSVIFSSAILLIAFVSVFIYSNLGTSKKSFASYGVHGAKTISTTNVILNEFTTLTANASSGVTSISVAASSLNANSRFSGNLAAGELVLIIQMRGATMNTASTTSSSWGAVTAYNNAGQSEFDEVASVPNSTTINLVSGLKNSYTSTGKVQVIRVPRYTSFTINSGASVTTQAWNGSTGGVIAIEDSGATTINGTIDASGLGFAGGKLTQSSVYQGYNGSNWNAYASTSAAAGGGIKGEGIAGDTTTYDGLGGRYGRGAPANGGGGGNNHNGGGGGGSNANNGSAYNGFGVADTTTSAAWKTAWDLDTSASGTPFHKNNSSGGGRGGYSYASKAKDPMSYEPGNSGWQGDNRANVGGLGGRPLDNTGSRIFMGGGGGAGDSNDGFGSPGAAGGGIVFLISGGNVSGTGVINANGADAANSGGKDAPGGGGGGGSVIIFSSASKTGLTINAKGGKGGNQILGTAESEGPGGGGGGGYLSLGTPNSFTKNYSGGLNGTTSSTAATNFLPNGASMGAQGLVSVPTNPYSSGTALPIELKSFSGEVKNKTVELSWVTASEINNDYFTIEKSSNARDYYSIGRISGAGNSTMENDYMLTDDAPLNGNNYYRLSQTDYDGTVVKYNTIRISSNLRSDNLQIKNYGPNPFNDLLHVDYSIEESGIVEIQLLNSNAQLIQSEQLIAGNGTNSFFFSNVADLKKGVYFLQLLQGKNKSQTARVIKG